MSSLGFFSLPADLRLGSDRQLFCKSFNLCPLEGDLEDLPDVVDVVDLDTLLGGGCNVVLKVCFYSARQDDLLYSGPMCGQDLLLKTSDSYAKRKQAQAVSYLGQGRTGVLSSSHQHLSERRTEHLACQSHLARHGQFAGQALASKERYQTRQNSYPSRRTLRQTKDTALINFCKQHDLNWSFGSRPKLTSFPMEPSGICT